MSIRGEFWDVPERGGIWRAEIEGGLDGRMAHLTAASFAEIDAQIQEEMQRRLPQPKPVVEPLPEPSVEVLPDDFHLPSEPVELPPDATEDVAPVADTPKRRGRPPRVRDANEDGA